MIKFCMQCDEGKADVNRRCRWCHFLSCPKCLLEGETVCEHCKTYRADLPKQAKGEE